MPTPRVKQDAHPQTELAPMPLGAFSCDGIDGCHTLMVALQRLDENRDPHGDLTPTLLNRLTEWWSDPVARSALQSPWAHVLSARDPNDCDERDRTPEDEWWREGRALHHTMLVAGIRDDIVYARARLPESEDEVSRLIRADRQPNAPLYRCVRELVRATRRTYPGGGEHAWFFATAEIATYVVTNEMRRTIAKARAAATTPPPTPADEARDPAVRAATPTKRRKRRANYPGDAAMLQALVKVSELPAVELRSRPLAETVAARLGVGQRRPDARTVESWIQSWIQVQRCRLKDNPSDDFAKPIIDAWDRLRLRDGPPLAQKTASERTRAGH